MNCNSCCRAKSQQKPFSGGAFPVQSHRCHSPRPLLLCVCPPPPPLAQLDPPPAPWAASPAPIPPSRRCELRVRAGEKAPAQGLGWVFWGFGFFFFSLRGTGFCWLTLPCNSKLWDWGDPWGSLFFFCCARGEGTGGSCWTEASAAPHSRDAFRPLARRGMSCYCSRPGGSEAVPPRSSCGGTGPGPAPPGIPPPRGDTLAPIHSWVSPALVTSEQLAGGHRGQVPGWHRDRSAHLSSRGVGTDCCPLSGGGGGAGGRNLGAFGPGTGL